jgi:bacteriorhodopsin
MIAEESLLTYLFMYSFDLAMLAMLAGVLYFSLERSSLALEYRIVATLAAVVSLIAAVNYFYMVENISQARNMEELMVSFPTSYRYSDWLLTTPLLLAMPVYLLCIRQGAGKLLTGLVAADVLMIVCGYVGEVNVNAADGSTTIAWGGFILAIFAWMYILFVLYSVLSSYSAQQSPAIQNALNRLRLFILLGWSIYPLGYFVSLMGSSEEVRVLREIIYCYADVINKVIYGMLAVQAAKVASTIWVDE